MSKMAHIAIAGGFAALVFTFGAQRPVEAAKSDFVEVTNFPASQAVAPAAGAVFDVRQAGEPVVLFTDDYLGVVRISEDGQFANSTFVVPAGKRLVIYDLVLNYMDDSEGYFMLSNANPDFASGQPIFLALREPVGGAAKATAHFSAGVVVDEGRTLRLDPPEFSPSFIYGVLVPRTPTP